MHIIDHLHPIPLDTPELRGKPTVALKADRITLGKRRWRGVAADGAEFGFDLDHAITHGTVFYVGETAAYILDQLPEAVLEIPFASAEEGARLGWQIGNLHFASEVAQGRLRVQDDTAIRQMLERAHISYTPLDAVFQPMRAVAGGHSHGHGHMHEHEHEAHAAPAAHAHTHVDEHGHTYTHTHMHTLQHPHGEPDVAEGQHRNHG